MSLVNHVGLVPSSTIASAKKIRIRHISPMLVPQLGYLLKHIQDPQQIVRILEVMLSPLAVTHGNVEEVRV